MRVGVELLFHSELGFSERLLMLKDMAQRFSTSQSSQWSFTFSVRGSFYLFICLFRSIQLWEKAAATARVPLPVCNLLCFVVMLEIFSAFCMRCCCILCWKLQHQELLLE